MANIRAIRIVQDMIRTGDIAPPYEHFCVDCGGQADRYDHRDYNQPHVVDPVCAKCNGTRGKALRQFVEIEPPLTKSRRNQMTRKKRGRPSLGDGKSRQMNIRMEQGTREKLDELAVWLGMTRADLIRTWIDNAWKRRKRAT